MIQIIILSGSLVILLLILNSFLNSVCGLDSSGDYGKVLEGTLTILILYLIIIALFGQQSGTDGIPFGYLLRPDGIPFVEQLDSYSSLTFMFKERTSIFIVECAKLISLTFVISLISNFVPGSFGGSGITGKIIRSIVLALAGVIANNYFLGIMEKTFFFSWALTALQCFLSGTALVMTPAMLIGNLLQLDPKGDIVSFLVKKLPQTKIGKSMSTAATNSMVLVFSIMIFESQYGSISDVMSKIPMLITLFAPLFIMLIGIRLMIKSVTK